MLFNIPFTGNIKLKGFRIIGADDESHPNKVKLSHILSCLLFFYFNITSLFFRFKNRTKMTFDDVSSKPDQEFELTKDVNGIIEYSTK